MGRSSFFLRMGENIADDAKREGVGAVSWHTGGRRGCVLYTDGSIRAARPTTAASLEALALCCGLALVPADKTDPPHRGRWLQLRWALDALERHGCPMRPQIIREQRWSLARLLDDDVAADRPIVHAALLFCGGSALGLATQTWLCEELPALAAELQPTMWIIQQSNAALDRMKAAAREQTEQLREMNERLRGLRDDDPADWWRRG